MAAVASSIAPGAQRDACPSCWYRAWSLHPDGVEFWSCALLVGPWKLFRGPREPLL